MKKLILIAILALTTMSCELFDPKLWKEASRQRREEGRHCYRTASGTAYCLDNNGNRVY